MDFSPELSALQGVIISADDTHPLSMITAKGGNEEKVKYVTEKLLKFLEDSKLLENGLIAVDCITKVRKFALYMILNCDFDVLELMMELEGIDLVISTIPTIPQYLMCELAWNLHMEKFIYEIISYSYPPLALEVAIAFVNNFKYLNPTECLNKLRHLSSACYSLIYRTHSFESTSQEMTDHLTATFENFQKCVKYFTHPPNSHKLNILGKDELYRYKGRCLNAALHFAYDCFKQFTSKTQGGFDDIYLVTYPAGIIKNDILSYEVHDNPKEILECLDNCHNVLLDTCSALVMDVSVDIFCAWSEFEENGKSMQQTVGELCYKMRTKLLSIDTVCEHPLLNMMQEIARKPIDIKDIINTTDKEVIINNINKSEEDKQLWLNALVHKEVLCFDLLHVIDSNLEYFDEEQCHKLYRTVRMCSENKDYADLLSLKFFQRCNISTKYSILDEKFCKNCFIDTTEMAEFNNIMTEIFNKLVISPDTHVTDVLTVFLQSPKQVYAKVFSLATENTQQTDIMLRVMRVLEKYSNHYYSSEIEPCIIKTTRETFDSNLDTVAKENNFIKFICGLKDANLIPGPKLLLLIVMPNMHKALLRKNIVNLNVQLKLWCHAFTIQELMEYRAPMLAMLAQVMNVVRWRIHTFVSHAPPILQITLLLQCKMMESYNNSIPENEAKWLRSKLRNVHSLNLYYYRALWNPPGNNFFEVISGKTITNHTDTKQITALLTQILCSCTRQEWCNVWDSLSACGDASALRILYDAMFLISIAERGNRTDKTRLCVMYCYRNLNFLVRYKFFKDPLTDAQVMTVVENIARMPLITTETTEDIESLLLPLFAYMAEKKNEYTVDLSTCSILRERNLGNLLNKVFVNGTET